MKASRSSGFTLVACAVLTILGGNCKKSDENPAGPASGPSGGTIVTGAAADAGSMAIGPAGGTFTVQKAGTAVDGLSITVPPNSYAESRTFQVSYAPIQSHQLGQYFNPISPLIMVANGGGYSDSVMTLRIPVSLPEGQFPFAFFYNPTTGELEGMPAAAFDSSSLTVITRHFAYSAGSTGPGLSRLLFGADDGSSAGIVVTGASPVPTASGFESGFRPGIDDFQFPNDGSYIAPLGHCAGQSIAAIWYYMEQKLKGAPQLWGRFDNNGESPATPKVWQDDVLAYRWCSVVQDDGVWKTLPNILAGGFQFTTIVDSWTFTMFCMSLLLTHKPSLMVIRESVLEAGHALVCYAAEASRLLVADPNFQGKTDRYIAFNTTQFSPYYSGPNASSVGRPYYHFYYAGNSALLDFGLVKARWDAMMGKVIGNNRFPTFNITVRDDNNNFVPLSDGYTQRRSTVSVFAKGVGFNAGYGVYNENEERIEDTTTFSPGKHRIGVAVYDEYFHWVGFKWTNITIGLDTTVLPLNTGNNWKYSMNSYAPDGSVYPHTREQSIGGATNIDGETWYQLHESVDGDAPATTLVTKRSNGIWAVVPPAPPFLLYQYPANTGDTYFLGNAASVKVDSVGSTRTVPAGTFSNCLVYTLDYGSIGRVSVRTFAVGVGLIEIRDYDKAQNGSTYLSAHIRLASYTLK